MSCIRHSAPSLITRSAVFQPALLSPRTRQEANSEMLRIAITKYNGMAAIFDRNPTDENYKRLCNMHEYRVLCEAACAADQTVITPELVTAS